MLSKASEYAIRALVYVCMKSHDSKRPGYREIAKQIEAPEQFTAKVLQSLVRSGFLRSVRGRGGGFFFDENSKAITILEVITEMEGDQLFTSCGIGLNQCSDEFPCPIHHQYALIREQYKKLAESTTIESLANRIIAGDAVLNRL